LQVLLSRSVWLHICLLVCLSTANASAEDKNNSEERHRVIANVQQLLSLAEEAMNRAERLADYKEALRPLEVADLIINQASVLSVEEAERLREEVHVLRKEIMERMRLAVKPPSGRPAKAVPQAPVSTPGPPNKIAAPDKIVMEAEKYNLPGDCSNVTG